MCWRLISIDASGRHLLVACHSRGHASIVLLWCHVHAARKACRIINLPRVQKRVAPIVDFKNASCNQSASVETAART
eukprot:913704-Amphidinium_carterae.2